MEELFNQLLITMNAIVEIKPNAHSITNVQQQTLYLKQLYQHPVNEITNKLVLQKLVLKIVSETTKAISATRSTLTTLDFINTYGD